MRRRTSGNEARLHNGVYWYVPAHARRLPPPPNLRVPLCVRTVCPNPKKQTHRTAAPRCPLARRYNWDQFSCGFSADPSLNLNRADLSDCGVPTYRAVPRGTSRTAGYP